MSCSSAACVPPFKLTRYKTGDKGRKKILNFQISIYIYPTGTTFTSFVSGIGVG